MKIRFAFPTFALVAAMLILACQKPGVKYVKYKDEAAVPRISADDAKKELDAGNAIFVDARGDAAFAAEHLPGAVSIPNGSTEDKYSVLPKGKKIIAYCT